MKEIKNQNLFETFLYNNIVPLISSAVVIALSWASISTQLAVINQKIDFLVETRQELIKITSRATDERHSLENRITKFETFLSIDNKRGE